MPLQISLFSSYCMGANKELTRTNIEHMKVIVQVLGISKSPKNKQALSKSYGCMTSTRW